MYEVLQTTCEVFRAIEELYCGIPWELTSIFLNNMCSTIPLNFFNVLLGDCLHIVKVIFEMTQS